MDGQNSMARGTPQILLMPSSEERDSVPGTPSDNSQLGQGSHGASSTTDTRSLLPQSNLMAPRGMGLQAYGNQGGADSSESLLQPSDARRWRPYHDRTPPISPSGTTSRRSSGSIRSRSRRYSDESRHGPFMNPFDDSTSPSTPESVDDINTQTVVQRYNITPSDDLILFPTDAEKDDYLHNPDLDDNKRDCGIWNKRGMANMGGLILILGGLLILLLGYPLLSFARESGLIKTHDCAKDPNCLSENLPLLRNVRTGLIDPDTPESAMSKTSSDGKKLKLVFSDEFNTDGRTFYDGDDPFFQAVDIWYGVTEDIEWYDPDAVSTSDGTLNIKFDAFQTHNLNYRSGMVQSWNKMCFTGGRLEASISLPGRGDVSGFWPGFWAMGNLGRPGYPATTDGMWPYSYYDGCDAGITPNQSSPDGISYLPGMRLPACTCSNEDHPSKGKSRSAPEIDAIEASVGYLGPNKYGGGTGDASQSFQAAPFDIFYQPDYAYVEVYDNAITEMNEYRGGPYQQAVSGLTWLNNDWYDGNAYQTYGFEYTPGDKGDISWFIGDSYTWKLDARAMRPNGNIGQRVIPVEPMSVIMNFGMSNSFTELMLADLAKLLPATMRFDYVRIYHPEGSKSITCDPEEYPTTPYIKKHLKPYLNQNITRWEDASYSWPKNTLMNDCSD